MKTASKLIAALLLTACSGGDGDDGRTCTVNNSFNDPATIEEIAQEAEAEGLTVEPNVTDGGNEDNISICGTTIVVDGVISNEQTNETNSTKLLREFLATGERYESND